MKKILYGTLAILAVGAIFVGAGVGAAHAQATATVGPTVPTSISASELQSGQVYVSWAGSTDTTATLDGYYLYRNGQMIATIPGYTFYLDTPGGGSFSYTVVAYDVAGNVSAQSTASPLVVVVPSKTPPTTPTGLVATVSSSSVTLSWQPSTDNIGVVGYYVSRNGVRIQTQTPIAGTTYTDTGLVPGTTYTYSVEAYDAFGNISGSVGMPATTIYDVTSPSVPQDFTATVVSPTQINLMWQPSTDNIEVAGYIIYRNGTQLVTVGTSSNSYSDSNLAAQTRYYYNIAAVDEVGNTSFQSQQAGATTDPLDLIPPSSPQNFLATPVSPSSIVLSWSPSTDNVAVAGYYIYREGQQIGTTASTTYTDTGLTTSTFYQYAVTAYDTSNNISGQNNAAATTLANTPIVSLVATTTSTVSPAAPIAPVVAPVVTTTPPQTSQPLPAQIFLSTNLYYGERNAEVTTLQTFLIQSNDLGANYATGFYGSLTQAAVKQFQCAKSIVCSGSPATTGWGSVGPRTRAAINAG